ncbi:GNAT family N-acetyltransferase [Paenibacillus sp. 598K]|uniref:GNAT family N-acetyltransferase n=1 Tax=Paenibacillus sp. 598K TaxID=1117987 RepID=UPI0021A9E586|nr:GNAT family N-acetyltransferase [Paenibacillus sp. 598K]
MSFKEIEELSLNHWQPLSTVLYDGWVLRFADGYTKRANSIQPLYDSSLPIATKLDACEDMYRSQGLATVFKLSPYTKPMPLDDELSQRGYRFAEETSVQMLELDALPSPDPAVRAKIEPLSSAWIAHFCRLSHVDPRHHPTLSQMLQRIVAQSGYVSIIAGGQVAGCGLGVVDGAYVGLYNVVIDQALRGRGLGEQMLLQLLHWGRSPGASRSCLAVVLSNAPAMRLYAKLGYSEVYRYWYRINDSTARASH